MTGIENDIAKFGNFSISRQDLARKTLAILKDIGFDEFAIAHDFNCISSVISQTWGKCKCSTPYINNGLTLISDLEAAKFTVSFLAIKSFLQSHDVFLYLKVPSDSCMNSAKDIRECKLQDYDALFSGHADRVKLQRIYLIASIRALAELTVLPPTATIEMGTTEADLKSETNVTKSGLSGEMRKALMTAAFALVTHPEEAQRYLETGRQAVIKSGIIPKAG